MQHSVINQLETAGSWAPSQVQADSQKDAHGALSDKKGLVAAGKPKRAISSEASAPNPHGALNEMLSSTPHDVRLNVRYAHNSP